MASVFDVEISAAASNRHLPSLRGDQASKAAQAQGRIIAHVDLDCFYVQVERSLNSELKEKPVAVVQYNPFGDLKSYAPSDNRLKESGSIIAVSYEARAKGVTRIMRGGEAKKKCPDILLVQVPTSHGKADLQIYRDASSRILKVLGERYAAVVIERASIDEVYLDVTNEASKLLRESDTQSFLTSAIKTLRAVPTLIAGDDNTEMKMSKNQIRNGHAGTDFKIDDLTKTIAEEGAGMMQMEGYEVESIPHESWFDRPAYMWSTEDRLLLSGALIVRQLREDVFTKLGFTCSAGIGVNKMLAKLSSGMHKPNKQTLVPLTVIPRLMKDLPFSRVQGFGGKLGNEIEARFGAEVKTMDDLVQLGRPVLCQAFGEETASWIWSRANGIDHDSVQDRALPISIGCSKSFRSSNMLLPPHVHDGTVLHWLTELAKELADRMKIDTDANNRRAKQLHVGLHVLVQKKGSAPQQQPLSSSEATSIENRVSDWHAEQGISLSKIGRLPTTGGVESIAKAALSMLQKTLSENTRLADIHTSVEKEWGITSLGLSATQFESIVTGKQSIMSFLQAPSTSAGVNKKVMEGQPIEYIQSDAIAEEDLFNLLDANESYVSEASLLEYPQISEVSKPAKSYEVQLKGDICSIEPILVNADKKRTLDVEEVTDDTIILEVDKSSFSTGTLSPNSATSKSTSSIAALFNKYVKHIDYDTFFSLPADIQQEVINEAMFRQNSSSTQSIRNSAAVNKTKKQKPDPKSSSMFNKWLGK